LRDRDILEIRRRRRAGATYREIAWDFNIVPSTVFAVTSGRTWGHVQ